MKIALITGSTGLLGSEATDFFAEKGFQVIGVDNDLRRYFFGQDASTRWRKQQLKESIPQYVHRDIDIRDQKKLQRLFSEFNTDIRLIIHAAAQPSHDWAAQEPFTDFAVNANGTLNLLEMTRRYCPKSVFIFSSTNKVYGDRPNLLPLKELKTRWELSKGHEYFSGINESMSIDSSKHSLFGASKLAADILVQEYGRYFGMKTASFRCGCLTGPNHSGARLHGFLSYLMKCCILGEPYTILGYKGKQVRDNIHSYDAVEAFYYFYQNPRAGEVYNLGGGRENNCSILEAVKLCEEITGKKFKIKYSAENRKGDHIWYISCLKKFKSHYPKWRQRFSLKDMLTQIYNSRLRWRK